MKPTRFLGISRCWDCYFCIKESHSKIVNCGNVKLGLKYPKDKAKYSIPEWCPLPRVSDPYSTMDDMPLVTETKP